MGKGSWKLRREFQGFEVVTFCNHLSFLDWCQTEREVFEVQDQLEKMT